MKTFPNPLSTTEEENLLKKCINGDLSARNKLIEHNLRLVAHIAKKYSSTEKNMEDLIATGTIGLIKGIDSFKPDKNIRLATYVSRCIDNEILMLLRYEKKLCHEIYIQEAISTDNSGNEISLIDIIEINDEDVIEKMEFNENIVKMYQYIKNNLSDREREIIKMRYGIYGYREYTQKEIALKLGISRSYVSRIEKMALTKLKACYENSQ